LPPEMMRLFQILLFHLQTSPVEFLLLLSLEIIQKTWLNRRKRESRKIIKKLKLKPLPKKLLRSSPKLPKPNQKLLPKSSKKLSLKSRNKLLSRNKKKQLKRENPKAK